MYFTHLDVKIYIMLCVSDYKHILINHYYSQILVTIREMSLN